MTFEQALKAIREGKKVRLDEFMFMIKDKDILFTFTGEPGYPVWSTYLLCEGLKSKCILSKDWEIVDE